MKNLLQSLSLLFMLLSVTVNTTAQTVKQWKEPSTPEAPAYIANTKGGEGGLDWRMPSKGYPNAVVKDTAWYNAEKGGAAYFIKILNKYRASYGLEPLTYSASASRGAKLQCLNLVRLDRTTHYNNPKYPTPMTRLIAAGHQFKTTKGMTKLAFENCNLYRNRVDPFTEDVMFIIFNGYKVSPTHNSAMLDADPTKVGVFTIKKGTTIYHVTLFAI